MPDAKRAFLLRQTSGCPQKGINYDLARFSYIGGGRSARQRARVHRGTASPVRRLSSYARQPTCRKRSMRAPKRDPRRAGAWKSYYEGWPTQDLTGYPGIQRVADCARPAAHEVTRCSTHGGQHPNFQAGPDLIGMQSTMLQSFDGTMAGVPLPSPMVRGRLRTRGRCSSFRTTPKS